MNTKNTTRKGFTTVELVIVIAVIAILAVVLVPTFSNLIEKANLSSDKQNVRNMNICLTTEIASQIKANKPEDFGAVKALLKEYGYGKDDNFIAKTKDHSIRWFVDDRGDTDKSNDKSVIVLVDNKKNVVVFPEEYAGVTDINDPYKYFDLSLPAAIVTPENDPSKMAIVQAVGKNQAGAIIDLAALYTFKPARPEPNTNYGDWYADFYISFTKNDEERTPLSQGEYNVLKGLKFAGYYPKWSYSGAGDTIPDDDVEHWLVLPVDDNLINLITPKRELPLVGTLVGRGATPSYHDILQQVSDENIEPIFKCGVVDTPDDNRKDIIIRVELRLTNLEGDIRILGVYEYEFK